MESQNFDLACLVKCNSTSIDLRFIDRVVLKYSIFREECYQVGEVQRFALQSSLRTPTSFM